MGFKAKMLDPNQVEKCKRDGLSGEDWLIFFTSLLVEAQFDALQVESAIVLTRVFQVLVCENYDY
jgi:hypothetical protein